MPLKAQGCRILPRRTLDSGTPRAVMNRSRVFLVFPTQESFLSRQDKQER